MALATLISVIAQSASTATAKPASASTSASTFWLACIKCFHLSESNQSSRNLILVFRVCVWNVRNIFCKIFRALMRTADLIYLLLNLFGICDLQKHLPLFIYLDCSCCCLRLYLYVNCSRLALLFTIWQRPSIKRPNNCELNMQGVGAPLTLLTHFGH